MQSSGLAGESLGEVAVEASSDTARMGRTLIFLMTSTAGINFSVGPVVGLFAGPSIGSVLHGLFDQQACADRREPGRPVGGRP